MSDSVAVRKGDTVRIHFEGRLPDGTVFESSAGGAPLAFTAGSDEILAGVSEAVIGMTAGEKREVELPPELGFGERHAELERTVERSQLPEECNVGDQLSASVGDRELIVWVREINDDSAVLDANHPLAGVTVTFAVELVDIN